MSATITNNIPHTTVITDFDSLNDELSVIITCDENYSFDGSLSGKWGDPDDPFSDPESFDIEINSDNKTASGIISTTTESVEITLTGNTKESKPTPQETSVINNITGTTESHTVDGENVKITITGTGTNKKFVNCSVSYGDVTQQVSSNTNILEISLDSVPVGSVVSVNGSYIDVVTIENNLTGATLTGLKDYYIDGETVSIIATANINTSFSDTNKPKLIWYDVLTIPHETEFTLSENKKTAMVNVTLPSSTQSDKAVSIELTGSTTPDIVVTGYGSINVYVVDDSILNQFSEARFIFSDGTETGVTPDGDLGEYVNRLHKVFFPVGDVTATTLKCGNTDTMINCDSLNDSIKHLDLGTLTIEPITGSSQDFNSNIQVFIPFVGLISIDSDFIGKELNLTYDIDAVIGEGVYNLFADGILIAQGECKPVSDVIYRTSTTQNLNTIGSDKFNADYIKGLKPYAILKSFEPLTGNNYNKDFVTVVIGDITGKATFENVSLKPVDCLSDEKEEILNLLKTGVIL